MNIATSKEIITFINNKQRFSYFKWFFSMEYYGYNNPVFNVASLAIVVWIFYCSDSASHDSFVQI
ncbi:hypothetical protein [Bacillus sp. X1(2014)]|uniref:hypothetical protein n=1 Tax=Bacillus sp. X1(2014) TaxID=1565991 RepID=UPI0021B18E3F|nr:hypothetical protein [Bacillus sp. X1(2014)]